MNPVFSLVYLVPLTLLLVIGGGWLCSRSAAKAPRGVRRTLVVMRVVALMALCGLLFNFGDWRKVSADQPSVWAVMMDVSASMDVENGEGKRIESAQRDLQQLQARADEAGVTLRVVEFDQDSRAAADDVDEVVAAGDGTDLMTSAESLLVTCAAAGEPLDGVVVLSDGRQTKTPERSDFALRARSMKVPFFGRVIGGAHVVDDLELLVVRKTVTAFPGQTLQIPVAVRSYGFASAVEAGIELVNEAGEVMQEGKVVIEPNDTAVHSFAIQAPDESKLWSVRLNALAGDQRTNNNSSAVRVRVLKDSAKVFLAEGAPYWDSKFLAQLLRRQPHMDVQSVHRLSDSRWFTVGSGESEAHENASSSFPSTAEQLEAYDLIVFGKNSEHFITPEVASLLRSFVRDQGGAVLFARSKPYSGSLPEIEALEPVVWAAGSTNEFALKPSIDGEASGLFGEALPAADSRVWVSLPDLKDAHRIDRVKPFTRVLAHGEVSGSRFPLLMVRRYGQGVSGLVNADGLWKWDFYPEARDMGNMYQEFWTQLIHWMLSYSEFLPGQQLSLRVSSDSVMPGDPVAVRIGYRGGDASIEPKLVVESDQLSQPLIVQPAAEKSESGRRAWSASFTPDVPGNYYLKLDAGDLASPEVLVSVAPPVGELDELSADPEFLRTLCESTGGALIDHDGYDQFLADSVVAGDVVAGDRGVVWHPHWMLWWLPVLLTLLLGSEWFLRRRNGLL
ncbi:hypothetical protein [Sulfuriroseicoccus oceanibius]|uniref:Glutamine amidotransferase domain-containing protein n=1 Tax=Sulfuriroseicoccus oceanibius TaxID=2707525 RepID=A0A6B3L3R3_9BACT|nr:hypothetical protein [Sulfuriroseicoccus oceanibius]QQL43978.1 hypothetical protein G3M56_008730 [Sulfuriroseicoccus oceanibius]